MRSGATLAARDFARSPLFWPRSFAIVLPGHGDGPLGPRTHRMLGTFQRFARRPCVVVTRRVEAHFPPHPTANGRSMDGEAHGLSFAACDGRARWGYARFAG